MKNGAVLLVYVCICGNLLFSQPAPAVAPRQGHSIAAIWPEVQSALDSFHYGTVESRLRLRRTDQTNWGRHEWARYAQLRGEIAYQFMESDSASWYLNRAREAIAADTSLAFLKGRNLGTLGKLYLLMGRKGTAKQYLQEALATAGTDRLALAKARQQLAFYFRTGLEVDQGLLQARQALRDLQLSATQPGAAQISPLYTQQLYADIFKEIAAAYNKLATGVLNAPSFLQPGEQLVDSAEKYMALSASHWPKVDTIGRTNLHYLQACHYVDQPHPERKAMGLMYVDSILAVSNSYPGRILYAEIVVNDLLSTYYINSRFEVKNSTTLGLARSGRALYLRQRLFGLTSPELFVPIYMMVLHRFMELDGNAALRTPEHYDELLEQLLEATPLVAPEFDCVHRDDYPDPEQVISMDYYFNLLAMRILCFHMRYHYSREPEDLKSGWKLVQAYLDLIGKEMGKSGSAYRLEYLMNKLIIFSEPALFIAEALHNENPMGPYWEEALRITELGKSIQLRYHILSRQGSQALGIPIPLRDRLAAASYQRQILTEELKGARAVNTSERINQIESELFVVEERLDSLYRQMRQHAPAYDRAFQAGKRLDRKEIRANLLAPDQALVVLHPMSQTGFALVLTADSAYFIEMNSRLDLVQKEMAIFQQEMTRFQTDSLHEPNPLAYQRAMKALYDQIWKPIETACVSLPSRVLVIPHSSTEILPMGQLLTDSTQEKRHTQWPYLGRTYAFSYAFSLESMQLRHLSQTRKGNGRWLGFAPEFLQPANTPAPSPGQVRRGGENLDPLFDNQPEVREIGSLVAQVQRLLGPRATKQALLAHWNAYEFIHLATHARVSWDHPDSSFVACTPTAAAGSDNVLRLSEIYQLDITTGMIVLSGCGTAIGQREAGEGMNSLARAFSAAGARSVVSSLWSVNDGTTRNLMRDFYQFLREGYPKDVALQKAEMRYLQVSNPTLIHPYYWASFRVYGDVSPVRFRVWWESAELWFLVVGVLGLMVFLWIRYRRKSLS